MSNKTELGPLFLNNQAFWEHHQWYDTIQVVLGDGDPCDYAPIYFKNGTKKKRLCFSVDRNGTVESSYYIGVDWLKVNKKAVCVQSKVNRVSEGQIDYLRMLFQALKHPDVMDHVKDLYEIKWDLPEIKISQQLDQLTPFLILQFLQLVKVIVRKGLKKSYYRVERNLRSTVKGKIMMASNIKTNIAKGRLIQHKCSFDEFGFDGLDNRILKKALVFVTRYISANKQMFNNNIFEEMLGYIMPAFAVVSDDVDIKDCKHLRVNPFFKEYKDAIDLAQKILRRFSYNINNTLENHHSVPPFWIDMSKLFELYVLGLLMDKYGGKQVAYHPRTRGNELDYIICAPELKMVVDAKYKLRYRPDVERVDHRDIRQVSGYARLNKVRNMLKVADNEIIGCLIIYPNPNGFVGPGERFELDIDKREHIDDYIKMYKLGVFLPKIEAGNWAY